MSKSVQISFDLLLMENRCDDKMYDWQSRKRLPKKGESTRKQNLRIFSFFNFRQYFKAAYYYLDEPHRIAPPAKEPVKWEDFPGPDGGNDSGAISVPNFADHVMKMHADSDAGFAKEYSEIQKLSYNKYSSDQSSHPDNKCKNRYLNIVACKSYTFDLTHLTKFLTFL